MMTMKRIEVPWTPACEREETALPRTGPAKTKLKGSSRETRKHTHKQTKFKENTRETRMKANKHTHKRSSREAQGKPALRHTKA